MNVPSTFSLIRSKKRPSKVNKKLTIRIEVHPEEDFLIVDPFLEGFSVDIKVLDLSQSINEIIVDVGLIKCILFAEFLVGTVVADFHLV